METAYPSTAICFAAIGLAFLLAWFTYRRIEYPIRFGATGRQMTTTLVMLMALLASVGFLTFLGKGSREQSKTIALQSDKRSFNHHFDGWSRCPNHAESDGCLILDPDSPPDIAVIGDSHAAHLASGIAELYKRRKKNVLLVSSPGCLPFFTSIPVGKTHFSCNYSLIDRALEEAIASTSIKTVILGNYGNFMLYGYRRLFQNESEFDGYADDAFTKEVQNNSVIFNKRMINTLERLVSAGKQTVLLVDVPELHFDPLECTVLRPVVFPWHKQRTPCAVSRKKFEAHSAPYHSIISGARTTFPNINFIDAWRPFCDQKLCFGLLDGELLYNTRDHLTPAGSRYLVTTIEDQLPW